MCVLSSVDYASVDLFLFFFLMREAVEHAYLILYMWLELPRIREYIMKLERREFLFHAIFAISGNPEHLSPGRQKRKAFLVLKPYDTSFPTTSSTRRDFHETSESRDQSQIQEKLLIHHERKPQKIGFSCEQERKGFMGPSIMLSLIRHTQSIFFEHYKSKGRAVTFQEGNLWVTYGNKRHWPQALTFTKLRNTNDWVPRGLKDTTESKDRNYFQTIPYVSS